MRGCVAVGIWVVLFLTLGFGQRYTAPGKVVNSSHDLSVSSTGATYQAATPNTNPQNQKCVFCHTPHHANPKAPLWNHAVSGQTYTTYSSTTLKSTMGQPTATDNTKLCLSCHDGTVALGNTVNNGNMAMANSVTTLPASAGTTYSPRRNTNLGTSLADDHPVAFTPAASTIPALPQIQTPPAGDAVALEGGKLQCTGCHNPHDEAVDPTERRFLRKNNSGAAICVTCHKLQGSGGGSNAWNWVSGPASDHQTHTNTYNAATNNPGGTDTAYLGSHTGYTATNTNGCSACHRSHTAHNDKRLLKGATAEVCFQCHDGNTTSNIKNPPTNTVVQNIKTAFSGETYKHPGGSVAGSSGSSDAGHDPNETIPVSTNRHAACDDCHNPHAAKGYETAGGVFPVPPALPSTLWGVRGVTKAGAARSRSAGNDDAQFQYEICFKCHGDSTNKPQTNDVSANGIGYGRLALRQFDFSGDSNCTTPLSTRANVRAEFTDHTTYPSYHPVVDPRNLPKTFPGGVPSLRNYVKDAAGNDILSRPLSPTSIIYCTDCHNNDNGRDISSTRSGTGGPAGPHGSSFPHLVERTNQFDTNTSTPCSGNVTAISGSWTAADFKLCDKCHDISTNVTTGLLNRKPHSHISTRGAVCTSCHDPHASKNPELINFDKRFVAPYSDGKITFTPKPSAALTGLCTLTCHEGAGKYHNHSY